MADRPRKWWLAVLLSLVTTGLGQLYNGQWRKALALGLAPLLAFPIAANLFRTSFPLGVIGMIVMAAVHLGVAGDAFLHARRQRHGYTLEPFNRVAVYIAVVVVMTTVFESAKHFIRTGLVRAYRMPSESMKPTFEVGDFFFADMTPAARRPARGHLVVHRYPPDPTQEFVKRVVAIAGDSVEVRDKSLYVNGMPVTEPYVIHADPSVRSDDPRDDLGPVAVPQGFCFVMGDNRDNSNDSRFFGPIDQRLVVGKPLYIYWSWDPGAVRPRLDRVGKDLR